MALIHELQIKPEDRDQCRSRIQFMITVYERRQFSEANIKRIFSEWESFVRRLKAGEKLIEKNYQEIQGNPLENQYFNELADLYFLLTKMVAIYDGFFQAIYAERHDLYFRARNKIDEVAA